MSQKQQEDLPQSWVKTTLGEVCDILAGYGFPTRLQGKTTGDLPFFKVGDISEAWKQNKTYLTTANNYLSHDEAKALKATPLPTDTTVFAKIGAAIALNRRALLAQPSLVDNNVMGLHSYPQALHPKYIFYFSWTLKLDELSRSTTVPSIRKTDVEAISITLPPNPEQQRIVDEIEKQFSRLDVAVEMGQRVERNLERLRAATLKAAVDGRLVPTEAELARAERRDYEPADVLLQRILRERRVKWEANQLAKMKEQGKTPKDDWWKNKYEDPEPANKIELPELPDSWSWATLPQLGELSRGKSKHRPRNDSQLYGGDYPFIQTGDVKHSGGYIRHHTQTYNEFGLAQSRLWPANTLCITIAANIAETGILTYPACFPDSIVGFLHEYDLLSVRFIDLFFRTARQQIDAYAPATAQKNINVEILSELAIPLPPLAEQHRIIDEVERRLSVIEELKTLVANALRRAAILRQKILRAGFAGKLVPQDPADEPAGILLERIRAEKAEREAQTRQARKERRRKMKGSKAKQSTRKPRRPLREVVAESKRRLTPEQLFAEAGFTPEVVEVFYEELRSEIEDQHIEQVRPDSAKVYLIIAANA